MVKRANHSGELSSVILGKLDFDFTQSTNSMVGWINIPFMSEEDEVQGAMLVVIEMAMALLAIILNLTVLISIKEKEDLMNSTVNIMIGNLCASNLLSAVFVKSIAVIYHGYAVASAKWDVQMAFCTMFTVTHRVTWAIFPYTIVVICWHSLLEHASRVMTSWREGAALRKRLLSRDDMEFQDLGGHVGSSSAAAANATSTTVPQDTGSFNLEADHHHRHHHHHHHHHHQEVGLQPEDLEPSEKGAVAMTEEGLHGRQKIALGFVWGTSVIYAMMNEQVMSKDQDLLCSVRADLRNWLNLLSLVVAFLFPLVAGPLLCPLGHLAISACSCVKAVFFFSEPPDPPEQSPPGASCLEYLVLATFCLVFVIFYPTQMFVAEVYFTDTNKLFPFMFTKYCFGSLHFILIPVIILLFKSDIRRAAKDTFGKTSTQNDSTEITFEQLQENLGIGVQPNG